MFKKISAVLIAALMLALAAAPALAEAKLFRGTVVAGVCGDHLTWSLNRATYILTISGTGEMYDYYANTAPWAQYYGDMNTVKVNEGVTSIGSNAFSGHFLISHIELPSTLVRIGDHAFFQCVADSVEFPPHIESIEDSAFYESRYLTSVTLPDSLTELGAEAFFCCKSLESAHIGSGLAEFKPSSFRGCEKLSRLTVSPENERYLSFDGAVIERSGKLLFYAPAKEGPFTVPDCVTVIGESAFQLQTGLTSLTVPDTVTAIEDCAFDRCAALASVTLGNGLRTIGRSAFNECDSLESVEFGSALESIDFEAFYGCGSITELELPDSLVSMGTGVFTGCGASSIRLGEGLTVIPERAFAGCCNLTDLHLGSRVEEIGHRAFSGCSALETVVLPETLSTIGEYAFAYSDGLCMVYFMGMPPASAGYCMFLQCHPFITLYYNEAYADEWAPNGETTWTSNYTVYTIIPFRPDQPGDADGNFYVDTVDALEVLRCALGISGNAEALLGNCDMDQNGSIDTTDALLILRLALNIA